MKKSSICTQTWLCIQTDRQHNDRKFIVVVEGVFDAIAIDGNWKQY